LQTVCARSTWCFHRRSLLAALLFVFVVTAQHSAAEGKKDFRLGEWRLGMSREQVLAKSSLGPYEPGPTSATLIARGADSSNKLAKFQLSFGERGLESVKLTAYEGSDYSAAENAAFSILTLFYRDLEGLDRKDFRGPKGAPFPQGDIRRLVKASLGRAREAARSVRAEQRAEILFTFDVAPATQPARRRILCQLLYVSRTDTYSVVAYEDFEGAATRNAPANIQLEGGGPGGI
jgi:hypothetical protein